MGFSHLNDDGQAHMVDVAEKSQTRRRAVATAVVKMLPETLGLIEAGETKKGDVLATARIAGIQAAKRTPELIPLCHQIALTKVTVEFRSELDEGFLHIAAACESTDRTGVEMEALTAVSVAALTIYDMVKSHDRAVEISAISLKEKTGGKSGDYLRDSSS